VLQVITTIVQVAHVNIDSLKAGAGKCCLPLPGAGVRAVIVADQGVIIHRDTCATLLKTDSEHQLDADWAILPDNANKTYDTAVVVSSLDAHALLAAITSAISDNGADIASVDTLAKSQGGTAGFVEFRFNLSVRDLAQLYEIEEWITA